MRKILKTILITVFVLTAFSASKTFSQEVDSFANSRQFKQGGYLIGPADVLEISVWKNAELSRVVIVRPDGRISLPLIGDVQAAGSTPDELRNAIVKRLQEFQETVVASVIVQQVNSYTIYMLGEVNSRGAMTLQRNTSILQAIALAGGFTEFASKNRILLIREDERIKVRFDDLVKGGTKDEDLILKPGDTIFIPGGTIFLP